MSDETQRGGWQSVQERGSIQGIKFFLYFVTFFGRAPGRAVLAVVMLYYTVFHKRARVSSQAYLRRVGAPSGFWSAYKHFLYFGQCTLDRAFLARGKTTGFRLQREGTEHLRALREQKRGAVLIGAHLGSFEALRAKSQEEALPINVVVNNGNAQMINAVLQELNPAGQVRLIDLGQGGLDFILKIRERVEAGEMVAIMGDRAAGDTRSVKVPFLGEPASFPAGAYLIASALKCPVFLTFGVYQGGRDYAFYCEPFAERIVLERKAREASLARYVARYAERLEHHVRQAPFNWFNFYDFWSPS